ncbi:conserved hypothetical protein [Magnetospirillum sp. UT-4]|nr:conserved hypothetical protein [Magnetospirillum sp. UT-4]
MRKPEPQPEPEPAKSKEHDFWWETLSDPQVRQILEINSETDRRELTAALCGLGEIARQQMMGPMGLTLYQAAVLFGSLYQRLGRATFNQIFGTPGNGPAVANFATRLKQKGVGSRTDIRLIARTVEGVMATKG